MVSGGASHGDLEVTSEMSSHRPSRPAAAYRALRAVVVTAALCCALLAPAVAIGEDPPVEPIASGAVDWGLKESFRSYMTGGIAQGEIAVGGGASTNADGSFRFPVSGGAFDPAAGATSLSTGGDVRFTGHHGQLDMRVSDVRVEVTSDGAYLYADVSTLPLGSSAAIDYANVPLAALDIAAVDPVIADGATTWTAVPTSLTAAGAPAFAGFYGPGTQLDPVTFTYEGNGGKPTDEPFTAPGTPFYSTLSTLTDGRDTVFADDEEGVLHKFDASAVTAVSLDDLEPVGASYAIAAEDRKNALSSAFDASAGRIFVAYADGTISAFTWTGSGYTRDELPGTHGTKKMAVAGGKLFIASEGTFVTVADPHVTVISGAPGAWTVHDGYADLDTGDVPISQMVGLPDGRVVATLTGRVAFPGGVPTGTPAQAIVLRDTGTAIESTPIPGTVPEGQPPAGITAGYQFAHPGPEGSILLGEFVNDPTTTVRLQWLSYADDGPVQTDGAPIEIANGGNYAVDPGDGLLYVSRPSASEDPAASRIDVLERDGDEVASVPGLKVKSSFEVRAGAVYALENVSPVATLKVTPAGVSPTIVTDPQDLAIELASATATQTVSLTAAAEATPAARVVWQRRAPGEIRWSTVEGAGSPTLTLEVGVADSGTRYRALFENGGGRIATKVATIVVAATLAAPPGPPAPTPPDPAPPTPDAPTPPIGESGAPAPTLPRNAIRFVSRPQRVRAAGRARVATLRCPAGTRCRVKVPKRVRVRIAKRTFRARVLAPARIRGGKKAQVRLKLARAARARLVGRTGKARVRVTLRAGGRAAKTRTAVVRLRG